MTFAVTGAGLIDGGVVITSRRVNKSGVPKKEYILLRWRATKKFLFQGNFVLINIHFHDLVFPPTISPPPHFEVIII